MTQSLESLAPNSLGNNDLELLQKLIDDGFALPSHSAPSDLTRQRKIIELILQQCVFNSSRNHSQSATWTQAGYALTILSQQTIDRAGLLTCVDKSSGSNAPLYMWLIPRLIHAAVSYSNLDGGEKVAEQTRNAVVDVLYALRKVAPAEKQGGSSGVSRLFMVAMRHMSDFCQDICDGLPSKLYGFAPLSPDLKTLVTTLRILCQTPLAHNSYLGLRTCAHLSQAARLIPASVKEQSDFADTVVAALQISKFSSIITEACKTVVSWPILKDDAWQRAVHEVLDGIATGGNTILPEIWWILQGRAETLSLDSDVGLDMVLLLFHPGSTRMPVHVVKALLPVGIIARWSQEVEAMGEFAARRLARSLDAFTANEEISFALRASSVDPSREHELRLLLQDIVPETYFDKEGDILLELLRYMQSGPDANPVKVSPILGAIFCPNHRGGSGCSQTHILPDTMLDLWLAVSQSRPLDAVQFRSLLILLEHTQPRDLAVGLQLSSRRPILDRIWLGMQCIERRVRLIAGRALSLVFSSQYAHPDARVASRNLANYREKIKQILNLQTNYRETAILLLGDIGRHAQKLDLCALLEMLLLQLGSSSAPLRSLAYAQLLNLVRYHGKTPYTLLSPFLEPISILLASNTSHQPDVVSEAMHFIGQTRRNFFETTLRSTLPALVFRRDREALEELSLIVGSPLGPLLLDHTAFILAEVFLHPQAADRSLAFLVDLLRHLTRGQPGLDITVASLMTTCIVPFVVSLVVELGDEDEKVSTKATTALLKAKQYFSGGSATGADLGDFLKPHMLGVISHLNETLHEVQGRRSVDEKRRMIRSLGALIDLVGDSMASFSPQIMASLQSTLAITELREETLKTWRLFIKTLRFADVGPFVGRTSGALVANWAHFSDIERRLAVDILNDIADNRQHLSAYIDEVVSLDGIPELATASASLLAYRKTWDVRTHLGKLLERSDSKNVAVATTSMAELRKLLLEKVDVLNQLTHGDTFDPIIARLMRSLLTAATRDGECDELRDHCYEALGILGALDPDRFVSLSEPAAMTIMSNFNDQEESIDFAIHLIRDLLVYAFRATNDTKHQNHLAFAIQELLKFCGFTPKILQQTSVPLRIRAKWQMLPKDQLETLTPLLGSRFSLSDTSIRTFPHPIYRSAPTYREWLQMWVTDLVGQTMSIAPADRGRHDSQSIFGVFRGVLRNQDVAVAHHILPHLVLHVLLSGGDTARDEICQEINAVLQDQVNPTGSPDKRSLSAQVIFDLMDHLSKWLRVSRTSRADRGSQTKLVDTVISSIETELMANAALQSQAYARSLRSFEQRIVQLRKEKRANTELQTYFERLHQIYAQLDEPDGMEGVSTFVISPSLEHQIREHESTGRWTSAQSCWEVRLQQSPGDVRLHLGLLRCLRNLGHYDTLRTHIRGVLSRQPNWAAELAPLEAEAAWIIGDWATVRRIGTNAPPVGQVFLALRQGEELEGILRAARRQLGFAITSKQYSRAYDAVLQLHLLREVDIIARTDAKLSFDPEPINKLAIAQKTVNSLVQTLNDRFGTLSPTFRVREAVLTIQRTCYGLVRSPQLKAQIGHAWIQSAKNARKAGYEQTAYSATLQAREVDAPFAFIQQAKLLRAHGGAFKALTDLENMVAPMFNAKVIDLTKDDFSRDRNLAKAVLLEARWANETDRFEANEIIERYRKAINLAQNRESPYYYLGHYYDNMPGTPEQMAGYNGQTCHYYAQALRHGVKYIYQTMPRMLTLWLDLGENKDLKKYPDMQVALIKMTSNIDKARKDLPAYQFLMAFPQIVSRIVHPGKEVASVLRRIMSVVIEKYPQQALWPTVGLMQSNRAERKTACSSVLTRAAHGSPAVAVLIKEAERLSQMLLRLADDKTEDTKREYTISSNFPYVKAAVPSRMIMPFQDALTGTLPSTAATVLTHNPFPDAPVEIQGIDEKVDVMPSLQRPKKLVFLGSNGRKYPFLCKPHDDLRKDARLMDFNAMINKFLKSTSESRRRQLYIRTYAVMPLNEECGLLEWVSNTNALKGILEKGYQRHGKRVYTNDLHKILEEARKQGHTTQIAAFRDKIIPMYSPTVFVEWFLLTWPEPSAWLASRMAYARTLAVMSMIGYVLGLGDRHGENILFDGLTGDTVHVDLNCLFDKGRTFEIPERVPFRLTHNMVDALGVTGVEGVFRKAAETALAVLRSNDESLMSVLEAFAHDPLVEWARPGKSKSEKDIRNSADRNLRPIKAKLKGIMAENVVVSVPNQVEALIKQATSVSNLGLMYQGWAPWL